MNHLTNIWRKFKASAKHGGTEVTQAKKTAGKQTLAEAHAEALEEMEQLKVHIAELEAAHEAAAEAAEPLTWGDLIQHTIALLNTMPEDQRHWAVTHWTDEVAASVEFTGTVASLRFAEPKDQDAEPKATAKLKAKAARGRKSKRARVIANIPGIGPMVTED